MHLAQLNRSRMMSQISAAGRLSPSVRRLPPSAKRLSPSAITCHHLPGPVTLLRSARRPARLMDGRRRQPVCIKVLAASEVQTGHVRSAAKVGRDRWRERRGCGHLGACHRLPHRWDQRCDQRWKGKCDCTVGDGNDEIDGKNRNDAISTVHNSHSSHQSH